MIFGLHVFRNPRYLMTTAYIGSTIILPWTGFYSAPISGIIILCFLLFITNDKTVFAYYNAYFSNLSRKGELITWADHLRNF